MFALFSCAEDSQEKKSKPVIKYLNTQKRIYTKGDTLRINNKKYIRVYGITHCKYGCPVLIEVD